MSDDWRRDAILVVLLAAFIVCLLVFQQVRRRSEPSRRWAILGRTVRVLLLDPALAVFLLPALLPLAGLPYVVKTSDPNYHGDFPAWTTLGVYGFLGLCAAVCALGQFALTSCAVQRLQGGKPTIGGGLAVMWARRGDIGDWMFLLLWRVCAPLARGQRYSRPVDGLAQNEFVVPAMLVEGLGAEPAMRLARAFAEEHDAAINDLADLRDISGFLMGAVMVASPLIGLLLLVTFKAPGGVERLQLALELAAPLAVSIIGAFLFLAECGTVYGAALYVFLARPEEAAHVLEHYPRELLRAGAAPAGPRFLPTPRAAASPPVVERRRANPAVLGGLAVLAFMAPIQWRDAIRRFGVPAQALVTGADHRRPGRRLASEWCRDVVDVNFQAGPDYAPHIGFCATPKIVDGLRDGDKVAVHFLRSWPDIAILDDDGGFLLMPGFLAAIILAVVALHMALEADRP